MVVYRGTVRAGHRLWGFWGFLRGEWKLWEILAVEDQRNPSDSSVPPRTKFILSEYLSSFSNSLGPHLDYAMAFNGQTPTIVVLKEGPCASFPPVARFGGIPRIRLIIVALTCRHRRFSGQGSDYLQHQRMCCRAVHSQEHPGPIRW